MKKLTASVLSAALILASSPCHQALAQGRTLSSALQGKVGRFSTVNALNLSFSNGRSYPFNNALSATNLSASLATITLNAANMQMGALAPLANAPMQATALSAQALAANALTPLSSSQVPYIQGSAATMDLAAPSVNPLLRAAQKTFEAAQQGMPTLSTFHARPELGTQMLESRRVFDHWADDAGTPVLPVLRPKTSFIKGILTAIGLVAGAAPVLASEDAVPAPQLPEASSGFGYGTLTIVAIVAAVASPILIMLGRKYLPLLREWISAKWTGVRDPLNRALRKYFNTVNQTVSIMNQQNVTHPPLVLKVLLHMVHPLAVNLNVVYDSIRRYMIQGQLGHDEIAQLRALKEYAAQLHQALPGSQYEFDMLEWFGNISPGMLHHESKIVAPHFPSLIFKAVQGTVAQYQVERVVRYDELGDRHPPATDTMMVGNDREEKLIVSGIYFLEDPWGKEKLVVSLDQRTHSVSVTVPKDKKQVGKEFFRLLDAWIAENHNYRGQRLGFERGTFYFLKGIRDDLTWEDYIVDPKTLARLQFFTINWLERLEQLKAMGSPAAKNLKSGLFLFGRKGTGKTRLSQVLMSVTKGRNTFLDLSAADIHSADEVRALFRGTRELGTARQPIILNFNEFDTMGAVKRDTGRSNQFLGELLKQMDGIEPNEGLLMIGTSNLPPRKMDSSLFRPGRFTYQLEIPLPDEAVRRGLLEFYFRGTPLAEGTDLAPFAEDRYTKGFLPADFDELTRLASLIADLAQAGGPVQIRFEHIEQAVEMMGFTRTGQAAPKKQP